MSAVNGVFDLRFQSKNDFWPHLCRDLFEQNKIKFALIIISTCRAVKIVILPQRRKTQLIERLHILGHERVEYTYLILLTDQGTFFCRKRKFNCLAQTEIRTRIPRPPTEPTFWILHNEVKKFAIKQERKQNNSVDFQKMNISDIKGRVAMRPRNFEVS
jgi:hypothetical protein